MSLSATPRVLSTVWTHNVRCLVMGGQACVLYGAAEFSRDLDLAILAEPDNLENLRRALDELEAGVIAVPPFDAGFLARGHAVHFRCGRADVAGFRVDIMARMRGVDHFEALWSRRTSLTVAEPGGADVAIEVLSLPDLVAAKKTQRDKDWPMIRRLLETDYAANREQPGKERVTFWLRELRTPALLTAVAREWPGEARAAASNREAVRAAMVGDEGAVQGALDIEQAEEREKDLAWWAPLRAELEAIRRER